MYRLHCAGYLHLVNEPFHTSKLMRWSRINIVHCGFLSDSRGCDCIILLDVVHLASNDTDIGRFNQVQA